MSGEDLQRENDVPGRRRAEDRFIEVIADLRDVLATEHKENSKQLAATSKQLTELSAKVDRVLRGFPEGDPDSHRKYHDALIKKAEKSAAFWGDMQNKLVERGIWGALGLMIIGAGYSLREYFNK